MFEINVGAESQLHNIRENLNILKKKTHHRDGLDRLNLEKELIFSLAPRCQTKKHISYRLRRGLF